MRTLLIIGPHTGLAAAVRAALDASHYRVIQHDECREEELRLTGASIDDANLSGLKITNADLRGASIDDSLTDGMTINGLAIADLLAAYRSTRPKN